MCDTKVFEIFNVDSNSKDNIIKTADILRKNGVVAIPTETVYGLAANALNPDAVSKIFIAKGRPQDNPLIVHICSIDMLENLVVNVPDVARTMIEKFMPGPFTIILEKSDIVPDMVSAGLSSVAIRFPANEVACAIIKECGFPLAAPSANISGSPSPTSFSHVFADMCGKIDAVIKSFDCSVGVESTVVSIEGDKVRLLRPGSVTIEQLKSVADEVIIDSAVLNALEKNDKPISPGSKYKHYSPNAKVVLIEGTADKYIEFVNKNCGKGVVALCFEEEAFDIKCDCVSYGARNNSSSQAKELFSALRKTDEMNASLVYAHCPQKDGVGLAVYNRLLRAAAFEVVKL